MITENVELRPKSSNLQKVGTAMEAIGVSAGLVGGFGSKLEVAGAGGVVFAAGYGVNRLADRLERRKRS